MFSCLVGIPADHVLLQSVSGQVLADVDAAAPFDAICDDPLQGARRLQGSQLQAAATSVEVALFPVIEASTDAGGAACLVVAQLQALNSSSASLSAAFARLASAANSSSLAVRMLAVAASASGGLALVCDDKPAAPPAAQGVAQAPASVSNPGSVGGGVAGVALLCALLYAFHRVRARRAAGDTAKLGEPAARDTRRVVNPLALPTITLAEDELLAVAGESPTAGESPVAVGTAVAARMPALRSLSVDVVSRRTSAMAAGPNGDIGDRFMTPPMLRARSVRPLEPGDGSNADSDGASPGAPQRLASSTVWSSRSLSASVRRLSAPRPSEPSAVPVAVATPAAATDFQQANPMMLSAQARKRHSVAAADVALDFDLASPSRASSEPDFLVSRNPLAVPAGSPSEGPSGSRRGVLRVSG